MTTILLALFCAVAVDDPSPLQRALEVETAPRLVEAARTLGDARRGAAVFDLANVQCGRCHTVGGGEDRLGPDLAQLGPDVSPDRLAEAILAPSKTIRPGFETIAIVTRDGRTITGLRAEDRTDAIVLRDPSRIGQTITVPTADIDERRDDGPSLMPTGLVDAIGSRARFLDLLRFLIECHEGGPERSKALRPAPASPLTPALPEYENNLDHAGLIAGLDANSLKRGQAIFERVCANCHGTADREGSLPTAPRFSRPGVVLRNGRDPYAIYRTLTHGFGQMPPQTWMVPRQKYDVIHYLRESYLKSVNPSQYSRIDAAYARALPVGKETGPMPASIEPWVAMDYGTTLTATYEVGSDATNFAYKGIAVRLDPGPGGVSRGSSFALFEHDTMRLAAAWTGPGFIDWQAVHFDGRHAAHPRPVGLVRLANPSGPGWANPADGSFDDVRMVGRDGRHYGPLPRSWAKFRGTYPAGGSPVIAYSIGNTSVLEREAGEDQPGPIVARSFEIGPRDRPMTLQAAHLDGAGPPFHQQPARPGEAVAWKAGAAPIGFRFDGMQYLEPADPGGLAMTEHDFTIVAKMRTRRGGTLFAKAAREPAWVPDGKALFVRDGRLVFDIGWVGAVTSQRRVDDGEWHQVGLTYEHVPARVRLWIDGRLDGTGTLRPKEGEQNQVARIGFAAADFPAGQSRFEGSIAEVAFWQEALEINAIDREKPMAAWRPVEGPTDMVRDETGNRHDALVRSDRPSIAEVVAGLSPVPAGSRWEGTDSGDLRLHLPEGAGPLRFTLRIAGLEGRDDRDAFARAVAREASPEDLSTLTKQAGPARWPDLVTTRIVRGQSDGPYAVDVLELPDRNPWNAQVRATGIDFLPGGDRAVVCTWDGDVWLVRGITQAEGELTWQRIASGLFQPLGILVLDGRILVCCRDQIVCLRDFDGDGEADFLECFNDDHQVTDHFHEFAMGLQADREGNLYYAKSARHALRAVVPQHGTLLKVSRDGSKTEVLATGFRAANGVCLNDDGTFFVTDQEGHWTPKNRINWVRPGKFYGNMWGYHNIENSSDSAMEPPVCWITNKFDRSPAELVKVEGDRWGLPAGTLLNLSYGEGIIFTVPHERVGDLMQGGMAPLPIGPLPTGIMRGRFHPVDGQLYACGMYGWASNQTQPGGLYRIRSTGRPATLPIGLHVREHALDLTFSNRLDPATVAELPRLSMSAWSLRRTDHYGSDHHDERSWKITEARLSDDGRTLMLTVPELTPTWCFALEYVVRPADGPAIEGTLHGTIHRAAD